MIQTMVYDTQNYWAFGLCPLSGIQKTREHNISETGSVSNIRWEGDTYSVESLRKSELQSVDNPCQSQSQSYFMTGGLPPMSSPWRRTLWDSWPVMFFKLNICGHSTYVTSSLRRGLGLSFTIAAGPHHRSHSQVQVPWDSWPPFTVSDSRLPQPGGPGIYIPQGQGSPVIPPGTAFALSNGPNRVGVSYSADDGNRSSFWNIVSRSDRW
jgi:hypothetical protein